MISSINMNEFLNLKENINIIDIRSKEKYNSRHIPNSINIPSEKLLLNPNQYLNKEEKYYIYCQKGTSSFNVCRILSLLGFNVISINGGYESWLMYQRDL